MIFGTTLLKDQEFGDAFVDVATSEKRLIESPQTRIKVLAALTSQ